MYNLSYFCGAYPSYSLLDLIPNGNIKEFRNKYDCNGNDMYLKFNANFKVVFEGSKNDKFYEQKENKINFIEDILYYPYLQNKFQIRKCFDEAHELLALPNYLSKKNHIALNKERRKKMLVQEKNKSKVMLYARNNEMEQNKENNFYDKLHYEFKEYFMKRDLYKNVGICQNNKVRGLCFNQENLE